MHKQLLQYTIRKSRDPLKMTSTHVIYKIGKAVCVLHKEKDLPFIPSNSAIDGAVENSHKLLNIIKHGKESNGLIQKHWSPTEFEELLIKHSD